MSEEVFTFHSAQALNHYFEEFKSALPALDGALQNIFHHHLRCSIDEVSKAHPLWRRVVYLFRYARFGAVTGDEHELVHFNTIFIKMLLVCNSHLTAGAWNSMVRAAEARYKLTVGQPLELVEVAILGSVAVSTAKLAYAAGELMACSENPKLMDPASALQWLMQHTRFAATYTSEQ